MLWAIVRRLPPLVCLRVPFSETWVWESAGGGANVVYHARVCFLAARERVPVYKGEEGRATRVKGCR